MIILHDPSTLLHETVELLGAKIRPALESPARVQAIVKCLQETDHDLRTLQPPSGEELEQLLKLICQTHKTDYIEHLRDAHRDWVSAQLIEQGDSILPECFVFSTAARSTPRRPNDIYARAGYYAMDMSSGIMDNTFASVIASANLAVEASKIVSQYQNKPTTTLALCRPPGHHCDGERAGGYCYINNAALVISCWRNKLPETRFGILDVDFHHGNGTQEIFYNDPEVFYASIHGEDEFPYYTGSADEQGEKNAIGTNLNLPLKTGSSFTEYLVKLETALAALDDFKIDFLVVSLGFDTFYLDVLGNFRIETDDYKVMARIIRQRLSHIPTVILLEGGYVLEYLGLNMLSFLQGWENATGEC